MSGASSLPLLAIELSQRAGGVAVIGADGGEHEIQVAAGRRDRDELAPAVAEALRMAGVIARSIRVVAIDVGPGGFTGLRISVAIGQAIAEVAGAEVMAVPGALVALASTPEASDLTGRALVLSAAKAGTAWGTLVERAAVDTPWRIVGQPGILDGPLTEGLVAVLADEHLDDAFRTGLPPDVPVIEPRFSARSLARLAAIGANGLTGYEDPARLQPIYPREPEAVRIWRERRADNPGHRPVPGPG
jgi:tRNA threonylcarbamoyl adenosine modification protein YeaZ